MSFESPLALLGLLAIPLLLWLYASHERGRTAFAARFGNPALLPNLVDHSPGRRRHLPLAILLLAVTTMIVGVARPHATVTVRREEATVVLAVDVSRSMAATDVEPTRLDAARTAAEAFLAEVPKRFRVAVVSFATRAVVALPPTQDRSLAKAALASLRPGQGTALGDAVNLAVGLSQKERRSDGTLPPAAVLVISDGAQMGGRASPQAAARRARALKVPVYAILVGTQNGTVVQPLTGGFHQIIRVPPRADTLRLVARTSRGKLFTATDDTRLREVYERLGSHLGHRKKSREITDLLAGGSAVLLLMGAALSTLWFGRAA
jgi:Ca-activated chloride channel family protein